MEKLKNKKMAVRLLWATFGSLLFAAGVNIIILPLHLYNGTFLGIAQLIRTFLVDYLKIAALSGINLDGIIFWLLNVPLFFMAWKVLGRGFFWLSVYTTTIETLFMTFIPIPNTPIIEDYRRACCWCRNRNDPERGKLRRRPGYTRNGMCEEIPVIQCWKSKYSYEYFRVWNLFYDI